MSDDIGRYPKARIQCAGSKPCASHPLGLLVPGLSRPSALAVVTPADAIGLGLLVLVSGRA